jgi:thiamine pyrophosphokinase
MSSHHIVREKQEPALLIAGLANFPDELLGQLLEWSPTVIVTADTAEQVITYGIKIDWLVADEMPGLQQSDVKLWPAQGGNVVKSALDALVAQGYPSVNVIADELDLELYSPYISKIDVVIFYCGKKIMAARPGFNKWKPAGGHIEFLTAPHKFVYTNLSPIRDNVYEILQDGFFSLHFADELVFLAEWL